MSGALWFLLGAFCAAAVIAAGCWAQIRWEKTKEALDYRTADGFLIERQSVALLQRSPDCAGFSRPARPLWRTGNLVQLDEIRAVCRRQGLQS
jgi:hypothetical protein